MPASAWRQSVQSTGILSSVQQTLGRTGRSAREIGKTVREIGRQRWACAVFLLWVATAVASPGQSFKIVVAFNGTTNGSEPSGLPIQRLDGNLYGTTFAGGSQGWGTVFKVTPTGTLTTLYNFCSQTNCADGSEPGYGAGLVLGTDGNFYGTTALGGAVSGIINSACQYGCGTVFKITPSGKLTTLYKFCSQTNCVDGSNPSAPLIQATDGNSYGTKGPAAPSMVLARSVAAQFSRSRQAAS